MLVMATHGLSFERVRFWPGVDGPQYLEHLQGLRAEDHADVKIELCTLLFTLTELRDAAVSLRVDVPALAVGLASASAGTAAAVIWALAVVIAWASVAIVFTNCWRSATDAAMASTKGSGLRNNVYG